MTYCLGVKIDEGIILVSDSRTNAGVDQLSTYSKMWRYSAPGQRQFTICTAGNLATSQAVINQIEEDISSAAAINLTNIPSVAEAAAYLGRVNKKVQSLNGGGSTFESTFLLAGEIVGSNSVLYLVYAAGNYISCPELSPFLQIGETKYGKPILDRVIQPDTSLERALVCGLVSMDATLKSNLTVGPPIEVAILRSGSSDEVQHFFFGEDDDYLRELRVSWNQIMKESFDRLGSFPWNRE